MAKCLWLKSVTLQEGIPKLIIGDTLDACGPQVSSWGSCDSGGIFCGSDRLRFDFTHNKALSFDETQKIELLVNEQIGRSLDVSSQVMSMNEAVATGAMALFGEKYGDEVRVINMGKFSCELCGGTHVRNTSQIRMFKIISEGGVSSGVRRIEAITGEHAISYALSSISALEKARASAGLAPVEREAAG